LIFGTALADRTNPMPLADGTDGVAELVEHAAHAKDATTMPSALRHFT
jgi:hypothetical protein